MEGIMKFQIGGFTCELSRGAGGEVTARWLPHRPRYLNKPERAAYEAARAAFLRDEETGDAAGAAREAGRGFSQRATALHGRP